MRTGISLLVLAFFGFGCAKDTAHLAPVKGFELSRYTGVWYEIARLPNRFEKGLSNVTAEYEAMSKGRVRVINRGFVDKTSEWVDARAVAKFAGRPDQGLLRVSFFRPFYADYKIIWLDKDYQVAVVTSDTMDFLWILCRQPRLAEAARNQLVAFAAKSGFPTAELEFIDQSLPHSVRK